MRVWLRKHPVLAILTLVVFGLMIVVVMAAMASSNQTITPQETRRRPTIAGASPAVSGAAEVTLIQASAADEGEQFGRLQILFFQAFILVAGIAASIYLTLMVTGNI